jgi:hypothetical protein
MKSNSLKRSAASAVVVVALTACLAVAAPRVGASGDVVRSLAPVSGAIVAVDRVSRTIDVLDQATGRTVRIAIPQRSRVVIRPMIALGSIVAFERITVGLQYRGVTAR